MAKKRSVYRIDKNKVPSVTTITSILNKPALVYWSAKMAAEHMLEHFEPGRPYQQQEIQAIVDEAKKAHTMKKTTAGDFGSRIHQLIEAYIAGQEIHTLTKEDDVALENFKKETEGWKWLGSEIVVFNEDMQYGGTADAIAEIKGVVTLVDFKTSSGVYPEHFVQCCLYASATPENKELRKAWQQIKQARILHLDKDWLTWQTIDVDLEANKPYLPHFRGLYQWVAENNS